MIHSSVTTCNAAQFSKFIKQGQGQDFTVKTKAPAIGTEGRIKAKLKTMAIKIAATNVVKPPSQYQQFMTCQTSFDDISWTQNYI